LGRGALREEITVAVLFFGNFMRQKKKMFVEILALEIIMYVIHPAFCEK
jgi:hypothetical protein